jgi:hypothetical protein
VDMYRKVRLACRPTRILRLKAEASGLPTRSDQHLSPKIDQAGGAALQTGMPIFRSVPPAIVAVATPAKLAVAEH